MMSQQQLDKLLSSEAMIKINNHLGEYEAKKKATAERRILTLKEEIEKMSHGETRSRLDETENLMNANSAECEQLMSVIEELDLIENPTDTEKTKIGLSFKRLHELRRDNVKLSVEHLLLTYWYNDWKGKFYAYGV